VIALLLNLSTYLIYNVFLSQQINFNRFIIRKNHQLEADPSLSIILQLLLFDWPENLFNLLLFLAENCSLCGLLQAAVIGQS